MKLDLVNWNKVRRLFKEIDMIRLERENEQLKRDLAHRDGLYRCWKAWAESLERKDAECPAE